MSFDPIECGKALQGVDPHTVQALRETAGTLAEHQARISEKRFLWQRRELLSSASQDLRIFTSQLEVARRQSRHPEGLPVTGPVGTITDEDLLQWATSYAWRNGRDDG